MANWKKRFPSKYQQASDLDVPIDAIVAGVHDELIGSGERAELKPVVTFKEKHVKPVVLNQARAEALATIAGSDDDDDWAGTPVRLQRGSTRFQGKKVDCVEIVAQPEAAPPTRRTEGSPSIPRDRDAKAASRSDDEDPF